MLELKGVSKQRGERWVLSEIDLCLKAGERCCILGASGSGKTTLLRLIAGLELPDQGEIVCRGALASTAAGIIIPPCDRQLAFVFQTPALWPHMTALENVAFGLRRNRAAEALAVLREVGGESLASRRPGQMSGGEQRCVEIARALAVQPRLLLLDEPFTHLDSEWKKRLLQTVDGYLARSGAALVHVTHAPD
ncbi:MAG: ATP-binding cassette domain-containing protein, partial [Planctomycetota bacterium]|nr:ATP-binding cassette domain-containing protein [Planctomycetota bacterium]